MAVSARGLSEPNQSRRCRLLQPVPPRRGRSPCRPATTGPKREPSQTRAGHDARPIAARDARQDGVRALVPDRYPGCGARLTADQTRQSRREISYTEPARGGDQIWQEHRHLFFAHVFEDAELVLRAWITHLDEVALYGHDDPLFPSTAVSAQSNAGFAANGFTRRPWKSTEPVRKIVNAAFETAGLPNYGPHAFRHMLARHAVNTSTSVAEFVANSQNLGHSDILTTLRSYGQISRERQRELVTGKSGDA